MSQITLNVFCYLNVQIEPEQSLETSLPEVTIWYSLIPWLVVFNYSFIDFVWIMRVN